MNFPDELRYTQDHEWIKMETDDIAVCGITDFAQKELGDIVYVEIETMNESLKAGDSFGVIEAVKTTADLYMPVSGTVVEFNSILDENEGDEPGTINSSPYNDGWIVKIKVDDPADLEKLLDVDAYQEIL